MCAENDKDGKLDRILSQMKAISEGGDDKSVDDNDSDESDQ